jgi:hypothetical protein
MSGVSAAMVEEQSAHHDSSADQQCTVEAASSARCRRTCCSCTTPLAKQAGSLRFWALLLTKMPEATPAAKVRNEKP